jgi:hypothetical protein
MSNKDADLKALAIKIAEMKTNLALVRLRLALRAYDPDQPRWPAGQSDGGQWRSENGAESAITFDQRPQQVQSTLRVAAEGIYDPGREPQCSAQLILDEELCRTVRSSRCWQSSRERYDNCMRGVYIPPLQVAR